VTHPFHPHFGQVRDIFERRITWGEDRVFFRDENARLKTIPAAWTSVGVPDPFIVMAAGTSRLHFAHLLELSSLLKRYDAELKVAGAGPSTKRRSVK
jgi:hypothetical protein